MTVRGVRLGTRLAAGAACVAFLVGPAVSATGAVILPHDAFYTLSLESVREGSTVADARGEMSLKWAEDCEGWASSQRFQLEVFDAVKPTVDIDSSFASWESKDGLAYRFTVRNVRNGRLDKELLGQATLRGEGMAGTAEFSGAEPVRLELPAGTVFPFRHLLDIIDAAVAGDKLVSRLVFDGTDEENVFEVSGIISSLRAADPDDPQLPASAARPWWSMGFAFFHADSEEIEPFYELTVQLLDNGITRLFKLDYGDFVIRVDLDRIELLSRPSC